MNFFFILLTMISVNAGFKNQGPCIHKLLATGDRAEDTAQFTMYLELLLQERVIQSKDLKLFLNELEHNKVINPIVDKNKNKQQQLHYSEFQKLLDSGSLDSVQISAWAKSFIEKTEASEKQKENSKQTTIEVPFFITHDGAMFYKINHPELGEAYKILKPGGKPENSSDWEENIWAIEILKDEKGVPKKLQNHLGLGVRGNTFVSKKSPARKACLEMGEGVDLPSDEDFIGLLKHFEYEKNADPVRLTVPGGEEYKKLFPTYLDWFWTSSIHFDQVRRDKNNQREKKPWMFHDDAKSVFVFHDKTHQALVRCIAKRK